MGFGVFTMIPMWGSICLVLNAILNMRKFEFGLQDYDIVKQMGY